MQLSHIRPVVSARFDEPNLVSSAGLVPVMGLAGRAGLRRLADEHVRVPTDKGANAGLKVSSLVAGMVAGADSIDDMAVLRHGGMGRVFDAAYAPSTLGSFLRSFTFGHVRQLDAVASRLLIDLAGRTPLLPGVADRAIVDIDDTIKPVYGPAKQAAGFGYTGTRGLNALLATVSTPAAAPVIVGQRLRRGNAFSARGANKLVSDALATVSRLREATTSATITSAAAGDDAAAGRRRATLLRADSAFYGYPTISAAVTAGAEVSVTVKLDAKIRKSIAGIGAETWTKIEYPDPVPDPDTGELISRAELAETEFTAFDGPSQNKRTPIPGRLVVRRIPNLDPQAATAGQVPRFTAWRYHALFTTSSPETVDTVTADATHRAHAIVEQVICDLKNSALAHLPDVILSSRNDHGSDLG